jgi:calcium-dependent protein kinase
LGKGGNGVVRLVVDKLTGEEYASKSIRKVLPDASSEKKREGHIASIKREVEVLRRLEGSLNIIRLVDVFEDDENVYIVQELCRGGELYDRIGERHYSERTVSTSSRNPLTFQQLFIAMPKCLHTIHRSNS